jgi:hypothetical protein
VRVRGIWIIAVALAIIGGAAGIAVAASGGDDEQPSVAGSGGDYCTASRDALEYEGQDAQRRDTLLAHVAELAPPELVSIMRTIRGSEAGSRKHEAAWNLWRYYNNNHCCQCIDAQLAPQIYELTPEQRERVEAGQPPV